MNSEILNRLKDTLFIGIGLLTPWFIFRLGILYERVPALLIILVSVLFLAAGAGLIMGQERRANPATFWRWVAWAAILGVINGLVIAFVD